jgi:hypothetical protein
VPKLDPRSLDAGLPELHVELAAEPAQNGHGQESRFDDVDEAFFAQEAELAQPVESFDDLESGPRRKLPSNRWFTFGRKPPK